MRNDELIGSWIFIYVDWVESVSDDVLLCIWDRWQIFFFKKKEFKGSLAGCESFLSFSLSSPFTVHYTGGSPISRSFSFKNNNRYQGGFFTHFIKFIALYKMYNVTFFLNKK